MGKTALVTGASRGIGRAIVLNLITHGIADRLILVSRHGDFTGFDAALTVALDSVADSENSIALCTQSSTISNPTIHRIAGDVSDIDFVRSLRADYGPADIVINNAAISVVEPFIDTTPELWHAVIDTNLTAVYNTCYIYSRDMIHNKDGCIINISSVWGAVGASCEVAYSAAKGGVDAFTRALAKELAPSHIRVNAVAPGVVATDMNSHLSEEEAAGLADEIPLGRYATPEEIADVVTRLIDMPDYLTGQIIRVDGGWI